MPTLRPLRSPALLILLLAFCKSKIGHDAVTPKSAIEVAFPSTGKVSRAVYCCRRQAKSIDGAARLQHGSQETEEIPAEHLDNILLPKSALEQAFRDVRQVVLILEVRDQAVSVARILRLTG
jgi:hypothetical protein